MPHQQRPPELGRWEPPTLASQELPLSLLTDAGLYALAKCKELCCLLDAEPLRGGRNKMGLCSFAAGVRAGECFGDIAGCTRCCQKSHTTQPVSLTAERLQRVDACRLRIS